MKNKFRAKGARSNEWIYGAYLKMLPYTPAPLGTSEPLESEYKHLIIKEGFSDWNMSRGIEAFDVLPETVGQCIGLKDINGKLIYEGDICEYNFENIGKQKAIIYFNKKYASFLSNPLDNFQAININDCIVIGNIYDNKELLKK